MPYINRTNNARPTFSGRPRPGGERGRNRSRPQSGGHGGGGRGKAHIAEHKFINKAVERADEVAYVATHTFEDFKFSASVQRNIDAHGYKTPSPIQDQAIPHIIAGKDVIGLANTGTGKTAAFLLPLIDRMATSNARPFMIVVTPTRELAQQIESEFRKFSHGLNLYSTLVVGGLPIDRQIRDLRRRPHVIIGTPGRIIDLLDRRELRLEDINVLVLDEADRMLDMGFLPNIRRIVTEMPKDRQTLFFSATITPEIQGLTSQFLNDPEVISVRTTETSDHVEQDVIGYADKLDKYHQLANMLKQDNYEKVLIFCGMKFGAQRLADELNKTDIAAAAIHGNKSQSQRQRALDAFKSGRVSVLVATDVAARGLDIPNVTHVINYDTPQTYDDYVHRIGRTGRAGARGHAHTFVQR